MNESKLTNGVELFLKADPFYPCLLIVHPTIGLLHEATHLLQSTYHWPTISVGRTLVEALLSVPPRRRPAQASSAIERAVGDATPGPVICTEIDLLFDPEFKLDPLSLFRQTSRQTPVVVAWPGTFSEGVLAYAQPEHSHYRTWQKTELCERCVLTLS